MYVLTNGSNVILQWPYSYRQLILDNPRTSFPRVPNLSRLADRNIFPVTVLDKPAFSKATQKVVQQAQPVLNNGSWELGWDVVAMSPVEQQVYAKSVATAQFEQTVSGAGSNFSDQEKFVMTAAYLEVKMVRLGVLAGQTPGSVDTPMLDAINAVFPGQTKLQIAQTIENRAQNYLTSAATALANKIKDGG